MTTPGFEDTEGMMQGAPPDNAAPEDGKEPITEEGAPEGAGDTMHIPVDFLMGTRFKAGDELVLKVVSSDDDGLEVAYATAPEKDAGEAKPKSAHEEIDSLPEY